MSRNIDPPINFGSMGNRRFGGGVKMWFVRSFAFLIVAYVPTWNFYQFFLILWREILVCPTYGHFELFYTKSVFAVAHCSFRSTVS